MSVSFWASKQHLARSKKPVKYQTNERVSQRASRYFIYS